jgi:integrase
MPRMKKVPEPFWRTERNCWFVQIGKKQHRLDPDEETAKRLYHELMSRPPDMPVVKAGPSAFVVEILDAFLDWTKKRHAEKTYTWHRDHVQTFVAGIPKTLTVADLKPHHVTRVMDAHENWSASTKNGFARSIQRGMMWAERQGLIDRTPIPRLEKPTPESREVVITPTEFEGLLALFSDQVFRDLLVMAWETGARPSELFMVEAHHVDLVNKRWVFKIKESKGKKKARYVYLSDKAMEITARLMETYPSGPLLRNEDGTAWMKDTVNTRFVRKKKALGRKLCLYHIRHSFCQRLLLEGKDLLTVSLLMGHTSPAMVMRHYQHLQKNPAFLRDALNSAGSA